MTGLTLQSAQVQSVLQRLGVEVEGSEGSLRALPASSRSSAHPELDSLSPRECEIAELLLEGHRVSIIARRLFISPHTVRNHLQSVYRKIGVRSQAELIEQLKGVGGPGSLPPELPRRE